MAFSQCYFLNPSLSSRIKPVFMINLRPAPATTKQQTRWPNIKDSNKELGRRCASISSSASGLLEKECRKYVGSYNDRNTLPRPPSIWGDQFLAYDEKEGQGQEELSLIAELKENVRRELMINAVNEPEQHMKLLELIDAIQRLGVAYHFEDEIEKSLQHIYNIAYADDCISTSNLYSTSLWFRLLRQQGFNVSSGIFKNYMDDEGNFMESLSDDAQGLLALYEASNMRVEGEEILHNALVFTTNHLQNIAKDPLLDDPSLRTQIKQALRQPLQKRLPRLEALRYMPIYQKEASHHEALLKLAKLDFNLLQSLHKKELSEICKWWKDLDLSKKLPYVRDRLVECYFWILAIYFEPQHSRARIFLTKSCMLVIVLDDTYDSYGTYEELEMFTKAVQRWSMSSSYALPEYMKLIYQSLIDVHNEMEELMAKEGKAYQMYYVKELMKEYTRSSLIDAKWANQHYIPTVDEHLAVTTVTCAYAMMIAKSYVGMGDMVNEESFKWVSSYPPIVKASCVICRLMGDLATYKEERERVHVASSVECHMNQLGVSEKDACDLVMKRVEDAWLVMNRESLRPMPAPRPLVMPVINLARLCDVLYKDGDGYGHPGQELIHLIKLLLVDPIVV